MTTPRPPRSGGPRRTPKVAGRVPTKATPPAEPRRTPLDEPTTTAPAEQDSGAARKSRFARKPKPVEAAAVETPAVETAPVETAESATPETAAETTESETATATAESSSDEVVGDLTAAATTPAAATASTDGPRGKNRPPTTKVSTIKPHSSRPTGRTTPAPVVTESTPRKPLLGWTAVAVVAALAVVVAVVAAISAAEPGVSLSSNGAFVNTAVTGEVSGQAKSRICTIFGVQYDKLDQWQKTAQSNVTGTAAQRFAEYDKAVRDALTQAGLTSGGVDCRVDSVGVKSIDGDDAVLLVNLILSQTQDQQASGSGTKRYQVSMHKVGDNWLVSNFADF